MVDILTSNNGVFIDYSNSIVNDPESLYYKITRGTEVINYPKANTIRYTGIDITGQEIQVHTYINDTWGLNPNYIDPREIISADRLSTPRKIELSGNVVGSTMFDGSANVDIQTQISIIVSPTQPTTDNNTPNGLLWIKSV